MHATNNHSDIILPLKFLLMMFLSDALMLSSGALLHIAEKPDSAVSGLSCSSATSVHSSTLLYRFTAEWSASPLCVL